MNEYINYQYKRSNKKKLPNVFSKDQIIKFFNSVEETTVAMGCLLSFCTGLRIGEIVSLKWSNIDFEERRIKIVDGKTGDGYTDIPIKLIPIMKKWKYLTNNNEYFIPYKNKLHFSRLSRLSNGFQRASKNAGLLSIDRILRDGKPRYRLTFHAWRHTFATFLWEKTGDIYLVQKALRHSSVKTSEIYTHVSDPHKRDKM